MTDKTVIKLDIHTEYVNGPIWIIGYPGQTVKDVDTVYLTEGAALADLETPVYKYIVTSNKPLALVTGLGNMPSISKAQYFDNRRVWEERSNGAATAENHIVKMELLDD